MTSFARRSALALCALTLVLLMGGCGGSDQGASSSSSTTTEITAKQAEAARGGEASIEDFGDEAKGSDRAAVTGAFEGYLTAGAAKDNATACSYLSANVQRSLEQLTGGKGKNAGCAQILPKLLSPSAPATFREQAEGTITKVRIEGDRGFVVFHAPGAKLYEMTMVREGGEWKVATVATSVLVPQL